MVQEGRNGDVRTTTCGPYRPSGADEGTHSAQFRGLDGSRGASQIHPARVSHLTLSDDQENGIWRKPAFRNQCC